MLPPANHRAANKYFQSTVKKESQQEIHEIR